MGTLGESNEFSVAEAGGAFVHAGGYDGYPSIRRAQRLSYFACALFLQYDNGRIMPHQVRCYLQPIIAGPEGGIRGKNTRARNFDSTRIPPSTGKSFPGVFWALGRI